MKIQKPFSLAFPCTYMQVCNIYCSEDDKHMHVLNVCAANNKCPKVTECGQARLAATTDYS